MDSLLDALQEGRLIELPDNGKDHVLQFLAHIIEAIPSVRSGSDIAGFVLSREQRSVTSLGMGFACPHARVPYDDDLICSVGWSPQGIDYGGVDPMPVHIVIMYLVPDNQRNHYLKEISILAKALMTTGTTALGEAKDLDSVRNFLLDLVSSTKSQTGTGTRARMIQLESRAEAAQSTDMQVLSNVTIEPLTIVLSQQQSHVVLGQNSVLVDMLDAAVGLSDSLAVRGYFEMNGWRIIKRSSAEYQSGRSLYDCLAINMNTVQTAIQEKQS